MTPWWKNILFTGVPLLLCFLLLEAGWRLAGFKPLQPAVPPQWRDPLSYALSDGYLGWAGKPHDRFRNPVIVGEPWITMDEFGYRTTVGSSADPDAPAVIFLGDSVIFCAELPDESTGPSQVAKLLNRERPVKVVNTGLRGYNTVQAKRQLEQGLDRFPRARIAVYVYVCNDYPENLNPLYHYPLKAPAVWWDEATRKFVEVEVTDPVIPFGQSTASFLGPPKPPAWRWDYGIRQHSALLDFFAGRLKRVGSFQRLVAPSIAYQHDPHGNVGPLAPELPEGQQYMQWAREHHGGDALETLLREMDEMCRRRGVQLLVTAFTYRPAGYSEEDYLGAIQRSGVRFVDLSAHFPGDHKDYAPLRVDGTLDPHYNEKGIRVWAEALVPELVNIFHGQEQVPPQP